MARECAPSIKFAWDFGDGSPEVVGWSASHSFERVGGFDVKMTATTSASLTFSETVRINVVESCGDEFFGATINISSGVFQTSTSGPIASVNSPVTFNASVVGGVPPYQIVWSFDDGSRASGASVTRSFLNPGTATVTITVMSACGDRIVTRTRSLSVIGYTPGGPDALVILGAGRAGAWSTDIALANPTDVEQFGTIATVPTPDHIDDCPGACLYFPYHLAPNGTTTVHLAPGTGAPEFVGSWYVVPDETGTLPVVSARTLRRGSAVEATLPVYHLTKLLESFVPSPGVAASPTVLLGARRSEAAHSNLLLTVLQPPGTVDLSGAVAHVEVVDASGTTVGSRNFNLAFGESRIVPDVVGALGVPALDLGQVRVTQTGGTNLLRAVLATSLESGAVTVSAGDLPASGPIPDPFLDAAIVAGGGSAGPWDTELVVGDGSRVATSVSISKRIGAQSCDEDVPDSGTISVLASALSGCLDVAPADLYLWRSAGGPPAVAARIFDSENPARSADVPVIRLSDLRDSTPLVFPFSAGSRVNLYLTEVERSADVSLHVEIRSSSGELLASRDVELSSLQHRFLADILGTSGVSDAHAGQIRVTKTGGDGIFWGLLASLGSDGSFTITPGIDP